MYKKIFIYLFVLGLTFCAFGMPKKVLAKEDLGTFVAHFKYRDLSDNEYPLDGVTGRVTSTVSNDKANFEYSGVCRRCDGKAIWTGSNWDNNKTASTNNNGRMDFGQNFACGTSTCNYNGVADAGKCKFRFTYTKSPGHDGHWVNEYGENKGNDETFTTDTLAGDNEGTISHTYTWVWAQPAGYTVTLNVRGNGGSNDSMNAFNIGNVTKNNDTANAIDISKQEGQTATVTVTKRNLTSTDKWHAQIIKTELEKLGNHSIITAMATTLGSCDKNNGSCDINSVNKDATVDIDIYTAACGFANGKSLPNAPTADTDLCQYGSSNVNNPPLDPNTNTYNWQCKRITADNDAVPCSAFHQSSNCCAETFTCKPGSGKTPLVVKIDWGIDSTKLALISSPQISFYLNNNLLKAVNKAVSIPSFYTTLKNVGDYNFKSTYTLASGEACNCPCNPQTISAKAPTSTTGNEVSP